MPFEFGIDYGCRCSAKGNLKRKKFLVLGEKPHDYKKALSDLAGIDASSHLNNPKKVVLALRNWFIESAPSNKTVNSATAIWSKFEDFTNDLTREERAKAFRRKILKRCPSANTSHLSEPGLVITNDGLRHSFRRITTAKPQRTLVTFFVFAALREMSLRE